MGELLQIISKQDSLAHEFHGFLGHGKGPEVGGHVVEKRPLDGGVSVFTREECDMDPQSCGALKANGICGADLVHKPISLYNATILCGPVQADFAALSETPAPIASIDVPSR